MQWRKYVAQVTAVVLAATVIGWWAYGQGGGGTVAAADNSAASSAERSQTITVGANGSVKVAPDVAYLTLAVETRAAKATAAQQANADAFAAVEKTLFGTFGIDRKDVQTIGFDVQPEYNWTEKDGQVLKGYYAVHRVQVAYRKLDGIGKLFDALSVSGANRIDGVRFWTEKQDAYELEALKAAMANAKAKADVLAIAGGRKLGAAVNIVQGSVSSPPIYYNSTMDYARAEAGNAPASTSIQTGQIEIVSSVTVQYAMN